MTINERLEYLESLTKELQTKLDKISQNTEEKYRTPYTKVGGENTKSIIKSPDIETGWGAILGGAIVWNDSELSFPPFGEEPSMPKKGYNKHTHSRYSGGALVKDVLEIVEYDWKAIQNKHSQQFVTLTEADIVVDKNSKGEAVKKIGLLDLVFNPDTKTWGTPAYEIDIKKCFFVERDENGEIVLDSKGNPKKSLLYSPNGLFNSIIWDEQGNNGKGCWRLLAVYASGNE